MYRKFLHEWKDTHDGPLFKVDDEIVFIEWCESVGVEVWGTEEDFTSRHVSIKHNVSSCEIGIYFGHIIYLHDGYIRKTEGS